MRVFDCGGGGEMFGYGVGFVLGGRIKSQFYSLCEEEYEECFRFVVGE